MQGIHKRRRARVLAAMALTAAIASGSARALVLDTGDGAGVPLKATRPGDLHEVVVAGWSTWDDATSGKTSPLSADADWLVAAPLPDLGPDPLADHASSLIGSKDWWPAGGWTLGRRINSALPQFAGIDLIGGGALALVLASKLRRRAV